MRPKRSRKGCPECRRRRIKCDETQPKCRQCVKTNRECHLQDSVFKHAFSSHTPTTTSQPIRTTPRTRQKGSAVSATPENTVPGLDVSIGQPVQSGWIDHVLAEPLLLPPIACPAREAPREHHPSPPSLPTHSDSEHTIESLKDSQLELFFLRHYSECIAPWMDLLYRYEVFSREVLTFARNHPILRYGACAVAAKQLGQMRVPVSNVLRGKTQEHIAKRIAQGRWGFTWYGIKYYEKAIQTLVKSITPSAASHSTPGNSTVSNHASPAVSLSGGDLMIRADGEDPIVRLLGTCILIQYEHLSANRDAWSGHLTGFAKLLDLIDDGRLLQPSPLFEQVYPWTKDIMDVKAGFWNFVVNDLEESFVSKRETRIDTENLALWRNMGLVIEDDGSLSLTSGPNSLNTAPEHVRDKVLSYFVIRLLCILMDYVAMPSKQASTFASIENKFDTWFQMLSPSFHPDGTFFPTDPSNSSLFSNELWFSNDLCSPTMMYYHMARMLLLIHRPSGLVAESPDLLHSFRALEQKLQVHAAAVISIVRGAPCDAVRLRAIQPLYVAGRCCSSLGDRRMMIGMLTDIEDELGIATGYRVNSLLREWGTSFRELGLSERSVESSSSGL